MITKPLLATNADLEKISFPVLATPKLDGIRCIKVDGQCLSRTFKPIRNNYVRRIVEDICPDGCDGELIVPGNFNKVSSAIMSEAGRPDFVYHIFDYVSDDLKKPYYKRMEELEAAVPDHPMINKVLPVEINSIEELQNFTQTHINNGYEGTMIRKPDGPYKLGRSSVNEGILLKVKQFVDAEAEVIGFEELMHNNNEQTRDAFGLAERSSHKDGLTPAGMLGALLVKDINTGLKFSIGTGFDRDERIEIWENRETYKGKLVTYKSQPSGAKDLPRFPVFKGFRHPDDIS